jgi:penicillin-binding protein 1A
MLILRWFLQTLLFIFLALILVGTATIWYFNQQLPDVNELKDVQMQVPLRVYSADNKLIAEFGEMRRQPVPLSEIPVDLQHALIATEDQRFYEHSGVDFMGLARAAVEVISTGKKVQGGSTITMQVARNFFLNRKKTYVRKMREILLALKIGRTLSKEKVLELYLNKVYFGKRAYGAAAAARVYYGEKLNQLTLAQMAMLAGLPQAPSALNPLNDPKAALGRRAHVLSRMLEQKYITQAQYQQAMATPLTAAYHHLTVALKAPYVAEMVRDSMVQQYGEEAYTMGLTVYTTINSNDQLAANHAVEAGLLAYDMRHGYRGPIDNWGAVNAQNVAELAKRLQQIPTIADLQPAVVLQVQQQQAIVLLDDAKQITIPWSGLVWARQSFRQGKWVGQVPKTASDVVKVGDVIRVDQDNKGHWQLIQLPEAEAALVSLNPQNGSIYAIVGGFNFAKSKFNRVTSAERQSGSDFKPFIYSAALDKGLTLATLVNDAPIVMPDQTTSSMWRPQNDNLTFNGPTRLRVGLMQSRNLVSIRLLREIGIPYAVDYAKRFGFDKNALPQSLSLALGTGILTPLELARGLAVFANGGYLIQPFLINKIVQNNEKTIFTANPVTACYLCDPQTTSSTIAPHVVTTQNAYLMNSAMKSVITDGTGHAARVLGRHDLAGKTGTTNDKEDAWFSGFNTQMLTVTWLGFDQPRSTFEYGAQAALPIWIDYMRVALKGTPEANLPRPPGIVTVRINAKTGQATDADDKNAIFEIFRSDNAPQFSQSATPASSIIGEQTDVGQPVKNSDQPIF